MRVDGLNSTATDVLPVRQTRRQTRKFYDRIAPFYDLLSQRTEWPVRQRALAAIAAQPGERILEIGPGTGHNLVALARAVGPDGHADGVDLSEAMLERAKTLVRRSGLSDRVTLRRGDAVDLPYRNRTMDGVLMTFTLELLDTPEIPDALAECRRVLRPGGRIVVASLTKDADADMIQRLLEWTHVHLPQLIDCRPIRARRALAKAGFRIVSAEVVRGWVPVEVVRGAVLGESEKECLSAAEKAGLPDNSYHAPG